MPSSRSVDAFTIVIAASARPATIVAVEQHRLADRAGNPEEPHEGADAAHHADVELEGFEHAADPPPVDASEERPDQAAAGPRPVGDEVPKVVGRHSDVAVADQDE